jgi:hypothetical protein
MADPNDPWAAFNPQAAPATGAMGSRPIISQPAPQPTPQTPAQAEGDALSNEQKRRELNKPTIVPQGATQMMTPDGQVVPIPGAAESKQKQNAEGLLRAAGVDLAKGIDPIADLIKGSTSGPLQHLGAEAYSVTGHATPGMQNIGKLKTIVSDMVLQLTGGGLGNQVSDADREFIIERVGNLADPDVPADQRLASWEQVKQRMANILGVTPGVSDERAQAELKARIARGDDPADTIHWLISVGRAPDKNTIAAIMANAGNHNPDVRPPNNPGGGGTLGDLGHMFAVGAGGVAQGVGDLAGLVSNPFIQGVNAITGSNFRPDMGANVRDTLGLPAPQNNREMLINRINDYGTQALSIAQGARLAATKVPGVIGNALSALGSAPLTDSASGAVGGAASDLTRQAGGGPVAQTVAGMAAAVPTALTGNAVNALMMRGPIGVHPVVNAGQQEGVAVNRAMVDPSLHPKITAVGKTMAGSRMMQANMRGVGNQIERRVQALGNGGQALSEPAALGGAVQTIGRRYIKASGDEFRKLYGDLRAQTDGVSIPAAEATTQIDGILARLNKAPNQNAKEISYLEGLKADIANGIDVETARDIGSKLRSDIAKGDVTFGKAEADVLNIRKALSQDTENGLAAAGKPDAAAAYREVDAAYSKRMDFIKQKLQGLLGKRDAPLTPEKAAGRLTAMAGQRGDASGLFQILNKATPEERADIAASFAESLGRQSDGSFSSAKFIKDAAKIPTAARVALWGKDGAKSLDNLTTLAAEHRRVSNALGGSPTGLGNDYRSWLQNLLLGGLGGGAGFAGGGATGAIATAAGVGAVKVGRDALNAKMLMSPKITGWLRSAPKTNSPQAINAHFDRLKAIAVREPALAPEIQSLQNMILNAANDRTTPAVAASQPDQGNQ